MSALQLGPGEPGLVSYLMAAYNAEQYIQETLESCVAQDYRPIEIIVVDDGSTDRTAEVVRDFKAAHEDDGFRIVYLWQENAGPYTARNKAIRLSRGEMIGYLDADDLMPPGRTRMLAGALTGGQADVAYGTYQMIRTREDAEEFLFSPEGQRECRDDPEWEEVELRPVVKFIPALWNFLMSRELAERAGPFTLELRGTEDFVYVVHLRLQSPRMVRTQRVVHFYRKTPGSITATLNPRNARDRLTSAQTVRKYLAEYSIDEPESVERLHNRFRRVAIECLRHGLKKEAVEAYEAAAALSSGGRQLFCLCGVMLYRVPCMAKLASWALWLRLAVPKPWTDQRTSRAD